MRVVAWGLVVVCVALTACSGDENGPATDAGMDADDAASVAADAGHDAAATDAAGRDAAGHDAADQDAADEDANVACIGDACLPCTSDSCAVTGRCVMSSEGPLCLCDVGYAGADCRDCAQAFDRPPLSELCFRSLVDVTVLAAGNVCEFGGVTIARGLDLDGDGNIGVDEQGEVDNVCAPDPGASCVPPAIGCACTVDRCGDYGVCLETATGALCMCDGGYSGGTCGLCDQGYVRSSRTGACVVPQQTQTTVHEPRGTNCPAGGSVITIGRDLNDDGTIDIFETTSTAYQCFPPVVRAGNILVSNLAELQNLLGVTEITGTLTITAPSISNLGPLSSLTRVAGLVLNGNTLLTDITGLNSLERIAGPLTIQNNNALLDVDGFAVLQEIDGAVLIQGNAALNDTSGFDALRRIGGALTIQMNGGLDALSGFPSLQTVVGDLLVNANATLVTIDGFGELIAVGGRFEITGAPLLASIDGLSGLIEVGSLRLFNLPALTSVTSLDSLTASHGSFVIENTGVQQIVGFNSLIEFRTELTIRNNDALTTIQGFGALVDISHVASGARVTVDGNDALTSIDALNALTHIRWTGQLIVEGNVLITANPMLRSFRAFDGLLSVGNVTMSGSPVLEELVAFRVLRTAYQFTITNASVGAMAFPSLTNLASVNFVMSGGSATSVALPELVSSVNVTISNALRLTSFSAPRAASLRDLSFTGNTALTTINLPLLTSAESIEIDGFAGTSIGAWSTLTALGGLRITNCPNLNALPSADALTAMANMTNSAFSGLDIQGNAALADLGLATLASVGGCFFPDPDCDVCDCKKVAIRDNAMLATCVAQAFGTRVGAIGTALLVSGNDDTGTCN